MVGLPWICMEVDPKVWLEDITIEKNFKFNFKYHQSLLGSNLLQIVARSNSDVQSYFLNLSSGFFHLKPLSQKPVRRL